MTRIPVVFASLSCVLACGLAGPPVTPNGHWKPADGGVTGIVVYEHDGGLLWQGDELTLSRITFTLVAYCQNYQETETGSIRGTNSQNTLTLFQNRLLPRADGEFELQLELPSTVEVDRKYRLSPNNPASTGGPVTAQFTGKMVLESAQAATVSYRVEYRDSTTLLSTDEASFVVSRVKTCE